MSAFSSFGFLPLLLFAVGLAGIIGYSIWQNYRRGKTSPNDNLKLAANISLGLGALPLIIYPCVILSNVMLAGDSPGLKLIDNLFLIGTTAYPLGYILCAVFATRHVKKDEGKPGFIWGIIPIIYIIILFGLFGVIS